MTATQAWDAQRNAGTQKPPGKLEHTETYPTEHGVNVSGSHALKKNILGSFSHRNPQAGSMLHISIFQYLSLSWLDIRPESFECLTYSDIKQPIKKLH